VIVGIVVGVVILLIAAVAVLIIVMMRKRKQLTKSLQLNSQIEQLQPNLDLARQNIIMISPNFSLNQTTSISQHYCFIV
jgi:hypothetical protein